MGVQCRIITASCETFVKGQLHQSCTPVIPAASCQNPCPAQDIEYPRASTYSGMPIYFMYGCMADTHKFSKSIMVHG